MKNKKDNQKPILNFDNVEEIKRFIAENESNLYSGKNVDNQEVRIRLDKGKGMIVETLNNKNWWEWTEYDEAGFVVSQGVSPDVDLEEKDYEY